MKLTQEHSTHNPTNANTDTGTFRTADQAELFYRSWLPEKELQRAYILAHRGHEHSGRLEGMAVRLRDEHTAVFAFDMRGHGLSPGRRGDAHRFHQWVEDFDHFVRFLQTKHKLREEDLAIVASSVGAVVAATWVHDHGARVRALVLAAPAFSIKLYVPFALTALRGVHRLGFKPFIKSYVRPSMLTDDPAMATAYAEDKLITRDIAAHLLVDLHDTSQRLIDDAGAIQTPTLILHPDNDAVVKLAPQRAFFEKLPSSQKRWVDLPGARHAVFHAASRNTIYDQVAAFVDACFQSPPGESLASAVTHTEQEYEELRRPAWGPKALAFALQWTAMRTVGKLSKGVALGCRTGFDSGETLDYVYRNEPQGTTIVGRALDRGYLNAVGWRGIRERGTLVREALTEVVEARPGQRLRVVDLACGGGRYVLEALQHCPEAHEVVLRDWSGGSLARARHLAESLGFRGAELERADAFDEGSVAACGPADVILVSGLYELFPDNVPLQASLHGITRALKPGGRLIYTCQPWHPQIEMIARVLTNRDGSPWIMRRRTQWEMDQLVRSAGLTKQRTRVESNGIFTVSTAIKQA